MGPITIVARTDGRASLDPVREDAALGRTDLVIEMLEEAQAEQTLDPERVRQIVIRNSVIVKPSAENFDTGIMYPGSSPIAEVIDVIRSPCWGP